MNSLEGSSAITNCRNICFAMLLEFPGRLSPRTVACRDAVGVCKLLFVSFLSGVGKKKINLTLEELNVSDVSILQRLFATTGMYRMP